MKGNIKKLAVFVMIAAIAMVMTGSTTSAGEQKGRKSIQGQYAFTGSGGCLMDPSAPGSLPGPNVWEGTYTFRHDGTGTVTATNRAINPGYGLSIDISYGFEYAVTDSGKIPFTYTSGTFIGEFTSGPLTGLFMYLNWNDPYWGAISPDGNTIVVTYGAPMIHDVVIKTSEGVVVMDTTAICQGSFVLIRQWEQK